MVSDALKAASVPLLTYDSPFNKTVMPTAPAYIDIDNIAFGRQLARLAIKLKPKGGCCASVPGTTKLICSKGWPGRVRSSAVTLHFPPRAG